MELCRRDFLCGISISVLTLASGSLLQGCGGGGSSNPVNNVGNPIVKSLAPTSFTPTSKSSFL